MLVELCKLLKDGPISRVILSVLGNLNRSINDFHNKGSIISAFSELHLLDHVAQLIPISSDVQVIAYLDSTVEDKVVFDIVSPIDGRDDLSHTRIPSCYWGLWITISKIHKDIVQNAVELNNQTILQSCNVHLSCQTRVVLNTPDGLPKYCMGVE
jgi:hypothetical protein